jgi:hypothetical protein
LFRVVHLAQMPWFVQLSYRSARQVVPIKFFKCGTIYGYNIYILVARNPPSS